MKFHVVPLESRILKWLLGIKEKLLQPCYLPEYCVGWVMELFLGWSVVSYDFSSYGTC